MRFIDEGENVRIQIAEDIIPGNKTIHADFTVRKLHFEEFLDHVIAECKKAYKRDELFNK